MQINFSEELFETMLADAKGKKTSVPALINKILNKHYNIQNSHKKVTNAREYIDKEKGSN